MYVGLTQSNHGSAAALFDGSELLACHEERFDRLKFSSGFPNRALTWCLAEAGRDIAEVDGIGFYMTAANFLRAAKGGQTNSWRFYPEALYSVASDVMKRPGKDPDRHGGVRHIRETFEYFDGTKLDVVFIDHHLAHAATSYLLSGFDRAAILCLDGNGDGNCMSFALGKGTDIEILYRQPFPHSLGHFYSTFTQFLGFSANSDEYKVMGLAAYGSPNIFADRIRGLIKTSADGSFEIDQRYFSFHLAGESRRFNARLVELLGIEPNTETEAVPQAYCDLAAAVQLVTEEVLSHIVSRLHELTGESNLAYGGGVALNCLATGRVLANGPFRSIYVPPNPGDGGLAIGVAAYLHVLEGGRRDYVYDSDFIGPEYSDSAIAEMLRDTGIRFTEPGDMAGAVAERLGRSKVVARFDGRHEFGPRALGNRSILADPRPTASKELVNRVVKFREPFRPFAPSVLTERASELFEMPSRELDSTSPENFMLSTVSVREEWQSRLGAVTHADGTSRVQTVGDVAPGYRSVIKAMEAETGVPAVLNTSFNIKGEPVVLDPADAVRCFFGTGINSLAIGPFLIDKAEQG